MLFTSDLELLTLFDLVGSIAGEQTLQTTYVAVEGIGVLARGLDVLDATFVRGLTFLEANASFLDEHSAVFDIAFELTSAFGCAGEVFSLSRERARGLSG